MSKRNWIVSVALEDDDDLIFGPYVEHRARQVVSAINLRNERRADDETLGDFLYATAYPIENLGPRAAADYFFGEGSGR